MKKSILLTVIALLATINTTAQTYQAIPDTVYARNACLERDNWLENTDRPEYYKNGKLKKTPGEYDSSSKNTWRYYLTWPDQNTTVAYYIHVPEGHFRADMVVATKTGKTATIKTKFFDPETHEVLHSADLQLNEKGTQQTVECVPDINIKKDAWYRLEFYCENGSSYLGRFDYVLCYHESKTAVCTPRIYSAIATYLNSWRTTNTAAPTGASYDFAYLEVQAPDGLEHINSYISTMNLLGGYLGIQSCLNQETKNYFGDYWRNVIFSMWDNGDTDKTPYLPDYLRSGGLDKDENVKFNRFGNEGTGIQAMKGEASWWEPGKWVQMLFTCRPEDITVTIEDENGQTQTFTYNNTLVTLWYKMEDQDEWIYQATLRKSGLGNYIDTWGSFLENWIPTAGQFQRTAVFRNCYLHSIASNKWYHCNRTTAGVYYDPARLRNDLRDRRIDMNWGIWDKDPNAIFMTAGGFVNMHDCVMRTYDVPLAEDQTCVDTIDTHRLLRRVDQAVKNYYANTVMEQRINNTHNITELKALMKEMLDEADHFNGYRSETLEGLQTLYEQGTASFSGQKKQLRTFAKDNLPLIYSTVLRKENIGTYRAYVLHNASGQGDIVFREIDGTKKLSAANATLPRASEEAKTFMPVTDNAGNWIIIRPDRGTDYYLYNIGSKKFLNLESSTLLSAQAKPVEIDFKSGSGFTIKQNGEYLSIAATASASTVTKSRTLNANCYFDLRDNITMQPTDEYVNTIIDKAYNSGDYNALIDEVKTVIELPEGVVGSISDPEVLKKLQEATENGELDYEELSELFDNAPRIAFEPETTLYRIRSAVRNYMMKPYMTLSNGTGLVITPLNTKDPGQIWQFKKEGEGYRLMTQGIGIQPLPNQSGKAVVVDEEPGVTYLVDLGGCHFTLRGSQSNTFAITASNSTLKTGTATVSSAQWYLEPVKTFEVSFDEGDVKGFYADFDITLDKTAAFGATKVDNDGTVKVWNLSDKFNTTIPAGTPMLLKGTKGESLSMSVTPKSVATSQATPAAGAKKVVAANIFQGTCRDETVENNSCFVLSFKEDGKPVMSLNTSSTLPANSICIAKEDVPAGMTEITFNLDEMVVTGIEGLQTAGASLNGKTYDLQGRTVNQAAHGIVIQNGKKVIK